jgi:hypothetical protein
MILKNILNISIVKTFVWTFSFLLAVISCNRDNSFDYPLVFTGDVINISDGSATFTGKITNLGKYQISESGFIWSLYHNDSNGIKIKNEQTSVGIYSLNTNQKLFPGKTYFVRAYVQTEKSTTYGRELTFKTPEKEVSAGKWSKILEYQIPTDWSVGCDIIQVIFTINDSIYTILSDGKLYSYSQIANTLTYLSQTIFTNPEFHFSIVYNGAAYVFSKNVFYRFDQKALTFTKLSDFGQNQINTGASGFLINDNIYVGIGPAKEYWQYNIANDAWQQVQSFPGDTRIDSYSFSVDNIGYIGNWNNTHAWTYDPGNNQWASKVNSPFITSYFHDCTNINSYGYCFYYNNLYKYYPEFDFWEKLAQVDDPEGFLCYPRIVAIGEQIYLINVWNNDNTDHYNVWLYEN